MKKNRHLSNTLTRREALRLSARYGAAVASVGAAYMLGGGALSFADAAASEAEKKAKAKHVLTVGLDGTLNKFPDRPVVQHSTWIHGAPEFKQFIEKNSEGRIYVDIHDAGALGSQTTALKKVQQGIIQGGSCSTQNAAQLAPIWNVTDVPYSIGPVENAWKVYFSKEFNDAVRAESEKRRLMLAFVLPVPRWLEMSRNVGREIRKPQDLGGMKMRVTGSKFEQAAFEILPANGTPIAWSELFAALKDGAVDGIHVSPTSVYDGGMAPAIGQIVDTAWMYNSDGIWLNAAWVRKLPGDLSDVVMEASYLCQKKIFDDFEAMLRDATGIAPDSGNVGWKASGAKIIHLTDDERAVWKDFLSLERNKDRLDPMIEQFGRKEYEMVVEVARTGDPTPRRWWTS